MNEREPTPEEVQAAIDRMRDILDKADRDPRAARVISKNDQLGAQLRDMNEEEWEAAVYSTMEETGLTEAETRNWLGRLAGKCDLDDARWTGAEGLEP